MIQWASKQTPVVMRRVGDVELSVIIVTHNVAHLIEGCLRSLYADCEAMAVEVFVVDSASSDRTVDVVREHFPGVEVHASRENIGFAAGNNVALPLCGGRYIALLNPDTVVHAGAMRKLIKHLDEHPKAGAVGPMLMLGNGEIQAECARNLPSVGNLFSWLLLLDKIEWTLRYRHGTKHTEVHPPRKTILDGFTLLTWERSRTCEVESICGACMVMRREVVEGIGLLDEASPLYLDDIDYCRRIRDAGWRIHYVAEAAITHFWKRSSSAFRREGDFYAMGVHAIWLYLRKHDGWLASTIFCFMACLASPVRICVSALASVTAKGEVRIFWKRQLNMALGLTRWAFRIPKAAPRIGFASEKSRGR